MGARSVSVQVEPVGGVSVQGGESVRTYGCV